MDSSLTFVLQIFAILIVSYAFGILKLKIDAPKSKNAATSTSEKVVVESNTKKNKKAAARIVRRLSSDYYDPQELRISSGVISGVEAVISVLNKTYSTKLWENSTTKLNGFFLREYTHKNGTPMSWSDLKSKLFDMMNFGAPSSPTNNSEVKRAAVISSLMEDDKAELSYQEKLCLWAFELPSIVENFSCEEDMVEELIAAIPRWNWFYSQIWCVAAKWEAIDLPQISLDLSLTAKYMDQKTIAEYLRYVEKMPREDGKEISQKPLSKAEKKAERTAKKTAKAGGKAAGLKPEEE